MKHWLKLLSIILLVCLVGVLGFLWYSAGLREYTRTLWDIYQLPSQQREMAQTNFFGYPERTYQYSGIVAGVQTWGTKSIWVWGRGGIRRLVVDGDTVYSYFRLCAQVGGEVKPDSAFVVERDITTDIGEWSKRVKRGDFVVILIAGAHNGGIAGNAREIKGHDWQAYMPRVEIGGVCQDS